MMTNISELGLSVPDTHHASGQSGYIGSEFAVLLATHLAPGGLEDRIGRNRNPSSDRLLLVRHEDQLHQQIVVILIQLLTGETNLHTVYSRQQRILDEARSFPGYTKERSGPCRSDTGRSLGKERKLDDLG